MAIAPSIGFIGLGKMGIPMAKNIIKAGYSLTVYNRTRVKTGELAELGAQVADFPKDLSAGVDVVISMVLDDTALETISFGPAGIFEGTNTETIFIDMSTVSTVASAKVAETAEKQGLKYLRAPVTGGVSHAEEGSLGILVSGPKDAYDQCQDIFKALGNKLFYLGSGEQGRIMKLVLNMQVGIISAMTAEALTYGEAGGVDWNQMIDIIKDSIVATPMINFRAEALKDHQFSPAFTAAQMAKDFDIILETGKAVNTPMPITSVVRGSLGIMKARGNGGDDFWEMLTLMESQAGLKS